MRALRLLAACVALLCLGAIGQAVHAAPKAVFAGFHPAYSCDYTNLALCGGESVAETSLRTIQDTSGNITFTNNNQLLNSATLSTQNVTVAPNNYLLLIFGTGSVTLSGTGSGTLSGTGASNRSCLAFTPTAGTLTLTVSGSVTSAQLVAVTYQTCATNPLPTYLASAGSEAFGPALDDGEVCTGLRSEEQRTNLIPNSGNVSNASWVRNFHVTVTGNAVVGTLGTQTAALVVPLNGDADAQTGAGALTIASGSVVTAWGVFKPAGWNYVYLAIYEGGQQNGAWFNLSTGAIGTVNPGITATIFSVQNGFFRVSVTYTTSSITSTDWTAFPTNANGAFSTGDGVNGIYQDIAQAEIGANPTSYIPTAASAVTRAADIITATGTFATAYKAASMSAQMQFTYTNPVANKPAVISTTGDVRDLLVNSSGRAALFDTGSSPTELDTATGSTTAGTATRFGSTYTPSVRAVAFNGVNLISDTHPKSAGSTVYLGSDLGTSAWIDGCLQSSAVWNPALPNSLLQQKSNVAPGPITWLFPNNDNYALEERRRAA